MNLLNLDNCISSIIETNEVNKLFNCNYNKNNLNGFQILEAIINYSSGYHN